MQTVPGVNGSLIAGSQSGLYRSDDHGASWQHLANGPGPMPALALAQSPNGVLFLATRTALYLFRRRRSLNSQQHRFARHERVGCRRVAS